MLTGLVEYRTRKQKENSSSGVYNVDQTRVVILQPTHYNA